VINNVLSLGAVPLILAEGAKTYFDCGMGRSRGTMPIQLTGNIKRGGLSETAFGMTLGELVDDIGGGTASGRPVKAVQVGGPLGAYFPRTLFDTPFDYEAFNCARRPDRSRRRGRVRRHRRHGQAGEVCLRVLRHRKLRQVYALPHRLYARGETVDKIMAGEASEANLALVKDLCNTMKFGSLCALGGFTPYPVMSALTHFPEDFRRTQRPQAAE
jgi:formate dehydrogenase iron-sulfur subunit